MPQLTDRQKEITDLMMEGKSFEQIANSLNLSKNTIKNMTHAIYIKFGVAGRVELLSLLLSERFKILEEALKKETSDEEEDRIAIVHSIMTNHFDAIYQVSGPTIKKAMERERQRRTQRC